MKTKKIQLTTGDLFLQINLQTAEHVLAGVFLGDANSGEYDGRIPAPSNAAGA